MKSVLLILTAAASLSAQSAGEIRGYAWDADGRPIPEAKVTLHAAGDAKADRTITAKADGSFDIAELAPGHYEITADAAKQQLTTESSAAVDLKSGQIAHADLTLGKSTIHYGFWARLARRLDGLPYK
jgi:hypothetical protein